MGNNEDRLREIGAAIASAREQQNLTQDDLANMIGFTNHAHLSRVESGKTTPSLKMLFKVADALGVQVNYFFTKI